MLGAVFCDNAIINTVITLPHVTYEIYTLLIVVIFTAVCQVRDVQELIACIEPVTSLLLVLVFAWLVQATCNRTGQVTHNDDY